MGFPRTKSEKTSKKLPLTFLKGAARSVVFNSHTSGVDMLWAGVPLLTLPSESMSGRVRRRAGGRRQHCARSRCGMRWRAGWVERLGPLFEGFGVSEGREGLLLDFGGQSEASFRRKRRVL